MTNNVDDFFAGKEVPFEENGRKGTIRLLNPPIVLVEPEVLRRECKQVKFHCEYCRRDHYHSIRDGLGHRDAHCYNQNSPYLKDGYILELKPGYEIITVSKCPPEISREWWDSVDRAVRALRDIDQTGCGGNPCRATGHYLEFRRKAKKHGN